MTISSLTSSQINSFDSNNNVRKTKELAEEARRQLEPRMEELMAKKNEFIRF